MAPYKGDLAKAGYAIETAFDEVPTQGDQTTWLGIIPNLDIDDAPEYKDYHSIGVGRDLFLENKGKTNITGNIPIELQNGRAIYLAMGGISEAGSAPTTHTITGGSTIPSICIEALYDGTNDFMRYYRGVKFDSLDIEAVDGAEVKATASVMGARGESSSNSASTISSVTTAPFMYHNGAVTLDSYGSFDITTFKWSVKNNIKVRHVCRQTDGEFAKLLVEGKRDYEITANVIIPDDATYGTKLYDMLLAGTSFTTSISLVRTASTDDMTLTASDCTLRTAPHNLPEAGEEVEVSLSIKPRTCSWSVRDSIATYA
jgi:hypothetical protein